MRGQSHLILGLAAWGTAAALLHAGPAAPLAAGLRAPAGAGAAGDLPMTLAIAGLAALLPDLDVEDTLLTRYEIAGVRPFAAIARALAPRVAHRGVTHGLPAAAAVFAALAATLLPYGLLLRTLVPAVEAHLGLTWALAAGVGYLSHLFADGLTKSGVPLLAPFWPARRFAFLPRALRVNTLAADPLPERLLVGALVALGAAGAALATWGI